MKNKDYINYIEMRYSKHQINMFLMVLESILRNEDSGTSVINGKKFTITISDVEDVK